MGSSTEEKVGDEMEPSEGTQTCCWASTDHPYFSVRHDKLAGFLRIKARSTMGLGLGRPKLDRTLPIRAQTSDLTTCKSMVPGKGLVPLYQNTRVGRWNPAGTLSKIKVTYYGVGT